MAWAPPSTDETVAPASSGWTPPPDDETLAGPSKTESFLRGAGNNFPLLPQAIAEGGAIADQFKGKDTGGKISTALKALISGHMEGTGPAYSEHLADWKGKAAAAKEENPASYDIGAGVGTLAPLAIPGVGEAMEAAPIASNAALGAASAVSDTDLRQDPERAALEGLAGGVVGGVTGAAAKGVGNFLEDVIKPAGSRIEANATAQALDLNPAAIRRMSRGLKNPEDAMNAMGEKLNEHFPDLIGTFDTAGSKYDKLLAAHDAAGAQIGDVVDKTSEGLGNYVIDSQTAIQKLKAAAAQYEGLTSARATDAAAELTDLAKRMEDLQSQGKLTFRALADLKTDVGSAYHNPNFQNHGIDQAYGILSDTIDGVLDRVTTDDPAVKPAFDKAKEIYKLTSNILPAMRKGVAKEVSGAGGGLANAGLGAAAVMGHPVTAGAGFIAKTGAKLLAPDIAANLAFKTVQGVKGAAEPLAAAAGAAGKALTVGATKAATIGTTEKLMNIVQTNPQALGPAAGALQEAAKRGPDALATTHFLLQQKDDDYRVRSNKILEEKGVNE